jgi:hypothetical protein
MLKAAIRERERSSFATNGSSPIMDELAERDYSLARVLNEGFGLRGFEAEISEELSRVFGRQPAGLWVPTEVLGVRDLAAGTPSAGGVSVELTGSKKFNPGFT